MAERKDGLIIWNNAPYGYKIDPNNKGQIIPDEETAEVVRTIFAKVSKGVHFTAIAKELNQSNVMSPGLYRKLQYTSKEDVEQEDANNHWTPVAVRRIALNPVYTGRAYAASQGISAVEGIQRFPIAHEPIVSEEVFEAVLALYRKRLSLTAPKEDDLFEGLVFCATCGSPLVLREGVEPLLGCRKAKSRGLGKCREPGYIGYQELKTLVVDELNKNAPRLIPPEPEPEPATEQEDSEERSKKIRERIDLIDRIVMRIYEDMESGLLLTRSGQSMITKFQNEISSLVEEDAKLQSTPEDLPEIIAQTESAPEKAFTVEGLTPELLKTYIAIIKVGPPDQSEAIPNSEDDGTGYHQNVRIVFKNNA